MTEQSQLLGRGEWKGPSEPGRGTPQPWPLGHLSLAPPTCPQTQSLGWGLESCSQCLVRLLPPTHPQPLPPPAQPGQSLPTPSSATTTTAAEALPYMAQRPQAEPPGPEATAGNTTSSNVAEGRPPCTSPGSVSASAATMLSPSAVTQRGLWWHTVSSGVRLWLLELLLVEWAVPTARGQAPWAFPQAGAGRGQGDRC